MNKESFFISLFNNSYIGDDGAVLNKSVISKDLFCENIHFKRDWMSLGEIAKKSMLVNISDAIAMNAKPVFALLGIKIPKTFTYKELKELYKGFDEICRSYNIKIIGGDTVAGDKLDISITLLSKTDKPIYRKGIKKGYLLAYTGEIGNVSKELKKLSRKGRISKKSKFIAPKLRDSFFYEASRYIKASLDISDGLLKDLSRLLEANRVGIRFYKKIKKDKGCSGEEYEILFAFNRKDKAKILSIGKKTKTDINILGYATRGKYKNICKENHF